MVSFLHSADWQIGKPYARVTDPDKRARLRQVRLDAIGRIGARIDATTTMLLVAGDLFDSPTPSSSDVSAVCAALGQLPISVIVIPGNHDHGAPGSVWHGPFFQAEQRRRAPNLQVLLDRQPLELTDAVILPCPLLRRTDSEDPCGWLRRVDWHTLPSEKPRIVLAHGAVHHFGATDFDPHLQSPASLPDRTDDSDGGDNTGADDTDEENPANGKNQLRLEGDWLEQVDYIALGDWHGLKRVSAKAWYSGTPEPDRFPRADDYEAGHVLRVGVERGSLPRVSPVATGCLGWHPLRFHCGDDGDLERLEGQLDRRLEGRVGQDLVLLELSGSLSLEGQERLEDLIERLEAQLLRLKRRGGCAVTPTAEELATLEGRPADPLISRVAGRLRERLELAVADVADGDNPDSGAVGSETSRVEILQRALMELHRALAVAGD